MRKSIPSPSPFQVEQPDAFPSFATSADALRVREILSRPASGSDGRSRRSSPGNHAISLARCAFEISPGRRCGHSIRANYPTILRGQHQYSAACNDSPRPHSSRIPGIVDEVVLEILAEVFRPERLRAGLERIRVEMGALTARRSTLEARAASIEADHEAASDLVLSAQRDRKAAEVRHWRGRMERLRRELVQVEAELDQIREDEQRFLEASEADVERILALGTDLPELIRRAAAVEGMRRAIVDALTESINFRVLGRSMFEVEVRFPAGAWVRRVFFGGRFRCSQAARTWAHHRLLQGVQPVDVAAEMNAAAQGMWRSVPWTPVRVLGAAAMHEWLETARPRVGCHRAHSELALELGVETKEVLATALKGRLGPARWGGEGLLLRPTRAELHAAFPSYARREVARAAGWDEADVVLLAGPRRPTRRMRRLRAVRRDAAGRMYALRSSLPASWEGSTERRSTVAGGRPLEEVVGELGRPECRPEDFVPLLDVRKVLDLPSGYPSPAALYAGASRGAVTIVYAAAPPGWRSHQRRVAYAYVPPAVRGAPSAAAVRAWLHPG